MRVSLVCWETLRDPSFLLTQSNSSRLFRVIGRGPIIQLRLSFFFFFLDKFGHLRPRWLDVD